MEGRRTYGWAGGIAALCLLMAPVFAAAAEPGSPPPAEAPAGGALHRMLSASPAAAAEVPVPGSPVPDAERKKVMALVNPVADDPSALSKGGLLFAANCKVCHGSLTEGPPPDPGFSTPPRDFRSEAFHAARTDGELFWAIKNGVDGTAMLPWDGRLSDREIWMVVTYLRTRPPAKP
jgi:mono/diheme cytochrome c family protein